MSEADGDTQGEAAEWRTLVADCTRRKELLCECMSWRRLMIEGYLESTMRCCIQFSLRILFPVEKGLGS